MSSTISGAKFSSGAPGYIPMPRVNPLLTAACSAVFVAGVCPSAAVAIAGRAGNAALPAAMMEVLRKSRLDVATRIPFVRAYCTLATHEANGGNVMLLSEVVVRSVGASVSSVATLLPCTSSEIVRGCAEKFIATTTRWSLDERT